MSTSFFPKFSIITVLSLCIQWSAFSASNSLHDESTTDLMVNSHGFNAKKRSNFTISEQAEEVSRGLTLIHLQSSELFEQKTFDTYGSPDEILALTAVLQQMMVNNSKFVVLAHDSAVKESFKNAPDLKAIGLEKLSVLKSRQAYIAHNVAGVLVELVDDTSISVTIEIPKELNDQTVYFPKETYEFEPSFDRFIAHAGGAVDGHAYTNTKNALDQNYKKGFRLFELDIIKTSDGKLVAAHDWKMWSRFTEYPGELPPTLSEFKKHNIYGDYVTLDMDGINEWFAAHPDAILVTDKLDDPIAFASQFVDKTRLIMELFSLMTIEEASQNGLKPMISQTPLLRLRGDKINYLKVNNVEHVAVSRRIIEREKELMKQLRDNDIKVFVYNVNFDKGKDEKYVYENEIGLVYGMYADTWDFEEERKASQKN